MMMKLEHNVNSTLIPDILRNRHVMVFEKRLDSDGLQASSGVIQQVEPGKGIRLIEKTGKTRNIPFCHLFGGIVYIMEPQGNIYKVLYKNEEVIEAYKNCNYTSLCLMLDKPRQELVNKGCFYLPQPSEIHA